MKKKSIFKKKKKQSFSIGLCIGLLVFLFVILFGIYLYGSIYYKNRFINGTYINHINFSGCTANEAISELGLLNNSYNLKIEGKDNSTETIKGKDFDFTSNAVNEVYDIFDNQNHKNWIGAFLNGDKNYTVENTFNYDQEKLKELINNLDCVVYGTTEPQNATISRDLNGFYIQPEVVGNIVDTELLFSKVRKAINDGENTINLSTQGCYKLPTVTQDSPSLKKSLEDMKVIENIVITINFDYTQEILDKSKILDWVTFDENGNKTVNEDNIDLYVSQLSYKYDTYKTDRTFITSNNEEITVGNGIYGYQINQEDLKKSIVNLIMNNSSEIITPKYTEAIPHYPTRQENDIGNTYIEISIINQHLWYYKNGEMVFETDVVTGLPNGERDTPTGVFGIWSREHPATLGTYAVQGYECDVEYWMPIDWTGVGLHDYPRKAYGGTIYKTNGSHGCINLPMSAAKYIYENSIVGTPVVIY